MTKYVQIDVVIENLCYDLLRYMSFSKYISTGLKLALDKRCTDSIELIGERPLPPVIFHPYEMVRVQA